ncbi:phosphatase PAP2 family protein [Shouchella sp. JSM 1781072]|uniref:phosphatase PAP2 family protein n=1 Tax=Shouchella sp. JSM 1781072 TaxID=3344581 RepID=UPI0035BF03E2
MKTIRKFPLLTSAVFLVLFFSIFLSFRTNVVTSIDYTMLAWFQDIRTDIVYTIMNGFAFIGSTNVVVILTIAVIVILLLTRSSWIDIFYTAIVMSMTGILNTVAKFSIARIRPEDFMMVDLSSYSFPSGHTMGAASFYSVLAFLIWRRTDHRPTRIVIVIFSTVMILLMGVSRLFLGVHYPTDVLGGFFLSGAILTFFYWLLYKRRA